MFKKLLLFSTISLLSFSFQNQAEAQSQKLMQLGFTMHYYYEYWNTGSSLNRVQNKAAIDAQAALGIKSFRMQVELWPDVTCSGPYNTFPFSELHLQPFLEIYNYALSKGLNVYIVSAPNPCYHQSGISRADYKRLVTAHFNFLAARFQQAKVWQIYNEANWVHKLTNTAFCPEPVFANCPDGLPVLSETYKQELYEDIDLARTAIRSYIPTAKITTNVAGSVPFMPAYRDRVRAKLTEYFTKLSPVLDAMGFDFYPQLSDLPYFPAELNYFRNLYGDKFWIAETGLPSKQGANNTVANQITFYQQVIPMLAAANVQNVYLYAYQDLDIWVQGEQLHYGLVDHKLFKKFGYEKIMQTVALFSGFDLNKSQRAARVSTTELLMRSYDEAFGRLPTVYDIFNTGGWVDTLVTNPQSQSWLVANHVAWMNQVPAAEREVISRAYRMFLGREPWPDELNGWAAQTTPSFLNLSGQFRYWLNSEAGRSERTRMVREAYQTYLGRTPYPGEDAGWINNPIDSADWLKEQFRFYVDQ